MKKNIPQSLKKHIRKEKARIRRQILNPKEQKEAINKLYNKVFPQKPVVKIKKNDN